jgi:hypothetical protein
VHPIDPSDYAFGVYYEDAQEFIDHFEHYKGEADDEQREWLEIIYEEYNDDGYIDWDNHHPEDSAWYYYMTEVLGHDPADIEKYFN